MIGWSLSELTYNDNIREKLGMEAPLVVAEVNLNAHHVYTDGSFTGCRNVHKSRWRDRANKREEAGKATYNVARAGRAAALFAKGHPPGKDTEPRPEWSGTHGEFSGIL